ncbi:BQ2448_468 [Microbotryum intermedium]|uniref:BQ2448_468 protein n=1 Tax=Microbotryum intermedium TaxID=269621 RepID=A0A238F5L7_9BASI|nr:BQ2448_468 [Microbotryum intermedium]
MALAPQFATHRIGSPSAAHTLELYLDLICPFSQKQLKGVRDHIIPRIESGELPLQIILRQGERGRRSGGYQRTTANRFKYQIWRATVPQPCSSTLVHEAVLGFSRVLVESGKSSYSDPEVGDKFRKFFFALMDGQKAYYDEPCSKETPNATRDRLADLAVQLGVDREAFRDAISVGEGNSGTPVTANLKLAIRFARLQGVHVTPTVALDGIIDPSISSRFTAQDWQKWLEEEVLSS